MSDDGRSVYLLPAMENNYIELLCDSIPNNSNVICQSAKHPFTVFIGDILRKRPDTIHLHWPHPYFLFYGLVPTKLFSTLASSAAAAFFLVQLTIASMLVDSTVWTIHNRRNHNSLQPTVERLVHIILGRIADTVTVWDEATRKTADEEFRIGHQKLEIVPHNNYLPIYEGIDESDSSSTCVEVSNQAESYDRVLLYFGRIREYKNVIRMIDTFDTLDADDTCLIVAGNPTEDMLTPVRTAINTAEDVIGDLRYVPDQDVPRYFQTSDIALFPYKDIFNSGSILLAMSFGTPFVAPRMGAIPGVAPDGNIIYNQLEEGLVDSITITDDEVERIGAKNRYQAESDHSQEAVQRALIRAYRWD